MDTVYCRSCGTSLAPDAIFCQRCGSRQPVELAGSHPVAPSPPSDSSGDLKWALFGLLLPPLWTRFIWRENWALWVKIALAAALIAAVEFVDVVVFGVSGGGPAAILVVNIAVTIVVAMTVTRAAETNVILRRSIQSKLDTCHDIIADIEASGSLQFLPPEAGLRENYIHALEMREEGMNLFEDAVSKADLVAADLRITRALDELRSTRTAISGRLAG